jgi:hypothetical protein
VITLNPDELQELLSDDVARSVLVDDLPSAVVLTGADDHVDVSDLPESLLGLPVVVIGVRSDGAPVGSPLADVVVEPGRLDQVLDHVAKAPIAAATLALLLRSSEGRGVAEGLVAESSAYSTLQSGPEFDGWRRANPVRVGSRSAGTVRSTRKASRMEVTLDRPGSHNAYNSKMRDELITALLAAASRSVTAIDLFGAGSSFCSGGDLDEFGSRADPASAHLIRLAQSAGWHLYRLSDRVTVHLHGACMGSGIELAAFAKRVVATPDTRIALPELAMGLVPGAGGTVSLPRRIGRQRTARLALGGETIGAETALGWGLVDEIVG